MNSILIISNEPPYGAGRSYHGLPFARASSMKMHMLSCFYWPMLLHAACKGEKCPRG
jgi:hypothetical protein